MKKLLSIVIMLVLCLSFTACESTEEKVSNIDALVLSVAEGNDVNDKKYCNNKYVLESAASLYEKLYEEEDYSSVDNLNLNLDRICNFTEELKELRNTSKINALDKILSGDDAGKLCRFIDFCYPETGYERNYCIEGFTTSEELKDFLDRTATKPIKKDNKGGYFDTRKDEYENEYGRWYDPLSKQYVSHGEIGTYRRSTSYEFYGDFLVEERVEKWYGDYSSNNNPNKTWYTTYYKNKLEIRGDSSTNSGYGVDSEEGIDLNDDIYYIKGENVLIAVGRYSITFVSENIAEELWL